MVIFEPMRPEIDKNTLIKILGARSAANLSHATGKALERFALRNADIIQPRFIYKMFRIASCKGSVHLHGGVSLNSPKAAKVFQGCTEVCCFLATIGSRIDTEIEQLTHGKRSADAYILDVIGSNAIESVVERFHNRFKKRMLADGRTVTLRISPGYCDWPLHEQKKIFRLIDAEKIGVTLMGSCLMQPRKTISGMFGVMQLSNNHNRTEYNPCHDCKKDNCTARRARLIDTQLAVS